MRERNYYLAVELGSTMKSVDTSGAVVNGYEYDVYGKVKTSSGPGGNEYQSAGEAVDGSTGLQYLRARYYDMESGGFMSRDPLGGTAGWTDAPYGYAAGQPTNLIDPTGLWCPKSAGDCASAVKKGAGVVKDAAVGAAKVGDDVLAELGYIDIGGGVTLPGLAASAGIQLDYNGGLDFDVAVYVMEGVGVGWGAGVYVNEAPLQEITQGTQCAIGGSAAAAIGVGAQGGITFKREGSDPPSYDSDDVVGFGEIGVSLGWGAGASVQCGFVIKVT